MKTSHAVSCAFVVWGFATLSAPSGPALSGAEFRLNTDLPGSYGGDFFVEFETDTLEEWLGQSATLFYQEIPLGQGYGLVSMIGLTYLPFPRGIFPSLTVAQTLVLFDGTKWNLFGVGFLGGGPFIGFETYSFSGAQIFPPPNDHFANQISLNGLPVSTTGTTAGSSVQPGEPMPTLFPITDSVWWNWTAPQSTRVDIDTFGSSPNTLLAVYVGPSLDVLFRVPGNRMTPSTQGLVRFDALFGTTYRIAVLTPSSRLGVEKERNIQLNISLSPPPPVNDRFADRVSLSGLPATTTGTNEGATAEVGEPEHFSSMLATASVWWSWTASETGCVEIDVSDSDIPAIVAVYTGSAVHSLIQVASWQGDVQFDAQSGTTYQIALDGWNGAEGTVAANFRQCPD